MSLRQNHGLPKAGASQPRKETEGFGVLARNLPQNQLGIFSGSARNFRSGKSTVGGPKGTKIDLFSSELSFPVEGPGSHGAEIPEK